MTKQMTLPVFIPSKDRACQLQLLLDSLHQNCPKVRFQPHVLYTYSNDKHKAGYVKLQDYCKRNNYNVTWSKETDFQIGFEWWLVKNLEQFVALFTDDCIFYREFHSDLDDILLCIDDKVWSFNWRLGVNTVLQDYTRNAYQPPLTRYQYILNKPFISWRWRDYQLYTNYGYYFTWDGAVQRASDLLHTATCSKYDNPCGYESVLINRSKNVHREYLAAPYESCVMVNSVNGVQGNVPAGLKYSCCVEELNSKYLDGYSVDLTQFNFERVTYVHNELPIVFKKD